MLRHASSTAHSTQPTCPTFQGIVPWNGDCAYDIGTRPSLYVSGVGELFLALHSKKPGTLVDFGCWNGRNLPTILRTAGPGSKVIGIDAEWATEELKLAKRTHPDARFMLSRLTCLPLKDGKVSASICWRVLHNLTALGELTAAVREIHRVHRPDSPAIMAVRAALPWMDQGCPMPQQHRLYNGTEREDLYFTRQALDTVFEAIGFRIIEARLINEGEEVNGQQVVNRYWAMNLIRI